MAKELEPNPQSTDLYARLGVPRDASTAAIKKAFRRAALTFHPDHASAAVSSEAFQRLCEARDVLRDPDARRAYDARWAPPRRTGFGAAPRPQTTSSSTTPPPAPAPDTSEEAPADTEPHAGYDALEPLPVWLPWLAYARTAAVVVGLVGNGLLVQAWWHATRATGSPFSSEIPYAVVLPLELLYVGLPAILHLLVLTVRLRLWED